MGFLPQAGLILCPQRGRNVNHVGAGTRAGQVSWGAPEAAGGGGAHAGQACDGGGLKMALSVCP